MQSAKNITILSAFGDNYVYLLEYSPGRCIVVDPGDTKLVLDALKYQHLQLTHILTTHHHADHIGGVSTLKQKTGCKVIGGDKADALVKTLPIPQPPPLIRRPRRDVIFLERQKAVRIRTTY